MRPDTVQWEKMIVRLGETETVWDCFVGYAKLGRVMWTKQTKYRAYNNMRCSWISETCFRSGSVRQFSSLKMAKSELMKDFGRSFRKAIKGMAK